MRYRFQEGEHIYEAAIEQRGEEYLAFLDGQPCPVEVLDWQPGQMTLQLEGRPVTLYWAEHNGTLWVSLNGCAYRLERPKPGRTRAPAGPVSDGESGEEIVRAPMPAQVRAVQVAEGDEVEKGRTLLLLEAMKMEIRVKAPVRGRVTRMLVQDGQAVEKEQPLAEMTAVETGVTREGD